MKSLILSLLILFSSNVFSQTAEVYFYRGMAKAEVEDYRGAISDYIKAIELDPKYANAYYTRGVAKLALEDDRGAIADFNSAIELNPKYAGAYFIEEWLRQI